MSLSRLASLAALVLRVGLVVAVPVALTAAPGCGSSTLKTVHLDGGAGNCAAGLSLCSGTCTNLQSSSAHCGACGTKCATGQTCKAGVCSMATGCAIGQMDCGGTCADITSDAANCGACGTACAMGETCVSSMCAAAGTCPTGEMMCTSGCADLTSDNANCGSCDTACNAGETCQNGACAAGNNGGSPDDCNTLITCVSMCASQSCVNTCGMAASPAAVALYNAHVQCLIGVCPNSGGGVCDMASRRYSQAACQTCLQGADSGPCTAALNACLGGGGGGGCAGGQVMCAGACTDVTSDASNCGACGKACAAGQSCTAGACVAGGGGGGNNTCNDTLACLNFNFCAPSDAACVGMCESQATAAAAKLLNALVTCLNTACPANGACANPNGRTCLRCIQNAQNAGAACDKQITACASN